MMRKSGIKAVAEAAGVSIGTVSRAFSTDPEFASRILPLTKKRILDAARELNYTPNYGAALLRGQRTKTIGFAISLPAEHRVSYSSRYIGRLLDGIGAAVAQHGYQLLLIQDDDYGIYMDVKRIDALVFVGFRNENNVRQEEMLRLFQSYQERHYPYIIINNNEANAQDLAHITVDNQDGMRQIAELIVRKGYQSVGFIGELSPNPQRQHESRILFLRRFLAGTGVAMDPAAWINGSNASLPEVPHTGLFHQIESGVALDWLVQHGKLPRCLVCGNDELALGALKYCFDHRIRVPEDLALIGFDGNPETAFYSPALTTVLQPLEEFGHMAIEYLVEKLEAPEAHRSLLIKPRLLERDSA